MRKRRGADDHDLDSLLPQSDLDDMENRAWKRYKVSFSPEREPCDALVSRIAKELDKRLLCFKELQKVKSRAFEQDAKRRRTKVGDIEFIHDEPEDEEVDTESLGGFLSKLWILMLAYT